MSVLIKGVKMPENCSECFCCRFVQFKENDYYSCNIKQITFGTDDRSWIFKQRADWCPLVNVETQEKGKNISKDGFLCSVCGFGDFGGFHGYEPKFCPNCGADMKGNNNGIN